MNGEYHDNDIYKATANVCAGYCPYCPYRCPYYDALRWNPYYPPYYIPPYYPSDQPSDRGSSSDWTWPGRYETTTEPEA